MSGFLAVASDLDGTLLRSDGTVSERTRDAVVAVEDAGGRFVIATGRPPRWLAPVVHALGDRGLVVCANGASVYDPASGELVERHDLAPEVVRELFDDLEPRLPGAVFSVEQGFDFTIDEAIERSEFRARLAALRNDPGLTVAPLRSRLDLPTTKLIVRIPRAEAAGATARVQAIVGDRAIVTHSIDQSFLELSAPGVHKAATVERLLGRDGVAPSEVVAFGDMPNDLELLRWAGHGVAVGNADPALLAAADEVTAANDDDGVALVLERLLAAGTLGGSPDSPGGPRPAVGP